MNRGEVWWLHEDQAKPRPVCILTRSEAIPVLERVIVAEASTTRRGIESEVDLDQADGLPTSCVLSLDNVRLTSKTRLSSRIATLSPARMHQVCEALRFATRC